VAVRAIAQIGKADDAPAVAALGSDGAKVAGWSVGAEAKAAASALQTKR
jgi:hypothetical protein